MASATPVSILASIGDALLAEQNRRNKWTSSLWRSINELKPDYAGKVGELFIVEMCKNMGLDFQYTEDVNSKDGTYDIMIMGKRVEIKTARIGLQDGFQHETLKTTGYDYILFLDIMPAYMYFTILPIFDMTKRHPVIGRTPHPRKGTTDVFKFDFSEKNIIKAMEHGCSIRVGEGMDTDIVKAFIEKNISSACNLIVDDGCPQVEG